MNYAGKFDAKLSADDTGSFLHTHAHVETVSSPHAPSDAIIVQDAQLLFNGDFKRSGADLILSRDDHELVLHDYFKGQKHAPLASPDGAHLTGAIVDALTGYVQYAQADGSASAAQVIGHVTKLTGSATAIRNGVSIILNAGDNVEKGDVVQSGSNSTLGITFIDGTVFGLSSNARMVLNEMIYDPNGSSNSSLLSLVAGTISFVAGETAKHGDMKIDTPVATMGIRGTAVLVEIDFTVPGQGGTPNASFQVLVEPDGTTGNYVLFDKLTLAPLATVNQAGQVLSFTNGVMSVTNSPLSPEMQKLITDVFSLKFTDNTNTKTGEHHSDFGVIDTLAPIRLPDGTTAQPVVLIVPTQPVPPGPPTGPTPPLQHIPGKPGIATQDGGLIELIGVTHSPAIDTVSGTINFADFNAGDRPTVTTTFQSFTYENALHQDVTATLTAEQLADIAEVEANLVLVPDPGNNNNGSVTWSYNVVDSKFDFIAAGETLTLTYQARVDNNYLPNNEFSLKTFTITITTGTNDTPTIATTSNSFFELSNPSQPNPTGSTTTDTVSGTITFADTDLTDTHTVTVTGVATSGVTSGLPDTATLMGWMSLSNFTDSLNGATGSETWTFAAQDKSFDYLAYGEQVTLTYTAQVADDNGGVITQPFTVVITGTNDTPTIATTSNSFFELSNPSQPNPTGSTTTDTVSGTISFTDVDLTDTHTVTVTGVTTSGVTSGLPDTATLMGWISLGTLTDSTNGATGSDTWTFAAQDKSFDYLAYGEQVTLTYMAQVADNNGGVITQPFTVTITGTNDTPVAHADSDVGHVIEAGNDVNDVVIPGVPTTSGNVLANDTDVDLTDTHNVVGVQAGTATGVLAGGVGTTITGTYGSLVLNADGTWTYTLDNNNPATNALPQGAHVNDVFSYTESDHNGGTSTTTLTVDITGTNDAPTTNLSPVAVTDTNPGAPVVEQGVSSGNVPVAGVGTASGNVLANDFDIDNGDTKTVQGVASGTPTGPLTGHVATTVAGTYGTVTIAADGSWTYTLNNNATATQALSQGEHVSDVFTYTMHDTAGATSSATLTIDITGTDDAPVAHVDSNAVTEAGVANGGNLPFVDTPTASGNVLTNDTDVDHGAVLTVAAVAGVTGNVGATVVGTYGSVTINANGGYSYTLNDSTGGATDQLKQGETATDVFTYTTTDEHGATSSSTLTINITGTNDAPTMSPVVAGTTLIDTPAPDSFATITGALQGHDVDQGETASLTYAALDGTTAVNTGVVGHYGTLTVNIDGSYTYVPNAAAINALPAGSVTDQFTVQTTDVHGATGTATFTVDVTGANDAPAVSGASNTVAYTEQATGVAVDNAIVVSDVDNTTLAGATATISSGFQSGDTLTINNAIDGNIVDAGGTIHYHYDAAAHAISLSGNDTLADYQAALRLVSFSNSANDDPTAGGSDLARTVTWSVNDGQLSSATASSTINVTAVNDAPVATVPAADYSATAQADISLHNTGLSVSDVDGGSGIETVTLAVGEGIITIATGDSGVLDSSITGNGTGSVTFSGTIGQINALLNTGTATVVYNDNADTPSASTTLTLTVHDNGNTGGGDLSSSASSTIDVTPVSSGNSAPVVTLSTPTVAVAADNLEHYVFPSVTITDPESATIYSATVTWDITGGGGIAFDGPGFVTHGIAITPQAGGGGYDLSGAATVADYEDVLSHLTFRSWNLQTSAFTVTVNDHISDSAPATSTVEVVVPSTWDIWTGDGNDGDWNTAGNWSLNHSPISTDYAYVDAGGTVADDLSGGNQSVAQLHVEGGTTLDIFGGSNSFDVTGASDALSDYSFGLQNAGLIDIQNATFGVAGDAVNGGTIQADGSGATVTFGSFTVDQGSGSGTIAALGGGQVNFNGTFVDGGEIESVSGSVIQLDGATIQNAALAGESGGSFEILADSDTTFVQNGTGIFTIGSGALVTIDTDATLDLQGTIIDSGTISGGTLSIGIGSTLDVEYGLNGPGATLDGVSVENSGTVQVDSVIPVTTSTLTLDGGTSITGGNLNVGSVGIVDIEAPNGPGDSDNPDATLDNVTVTGSGEIDVGLVGSGAVLALDNETTMTGGTLDIGTNGEVYVRNDGSSLLVATLDGVTVINGGSIEIGAAQTASGSTLILDGGTTISGGTLALDDAGDVVDVEAGANGPNHGATLDGVTVTTTNAASTIEVGATSTATLTLDGGTTITGGTMTIGNGSTLTLHDAAVTGTAITMTGTGDTIVADQSSSLSGITIAGLSTGDAIDLVGVGSGIADFVTNAVTGRLELHYGPNSGDFFTFAAGYTANDFTVSSHSGEIDVVFTHTGDIAPTIAGDISVLAVKGSGVQITGAAVGAATADLQAVDPDSTPDQLTFTVVDTPSHGHLANSPTGSAITSFTQAQLNSGSVFFVTDSTSYVGQGSFTVSLSDGVASSSPTTVGVTMVDAQLSVLTTNDYNFDQDNSIGAMGSAPVSGVTSIAFTISNPAANRDFAFTGTGFVYDPVNGFSAGTITSIVETAHDTGAQLASFGLYVPAADWINATIAAANGDQSLIEGLTRAWTFNFVGNAGADAFGAADVNDIFTGRAGNDSFDGQFGYDRANYGNATGPINVQLADGIVTGDASVGTDTLHSIEMVTGGNFADTYNAGATTNNPGGFSSASTNNGSTVTSNTAGLFNEFEGRGGNDIITGNGQTRVSYLHATAGVTATFTQNSWTSSTSGGSGTVVGDASTGTDTFTGVNSVRGTNFNDTFTGSNNPFGTAENFEGLGGNDIINGGLGFDRAVYNFAHDGVGITVNLADGTVTGGPDTGTDTLQGIEGIWGTEFADIYNAGATTLNPGGFSPTSTNAGNSPISSSNPGASNFNEFEGGGGNDTITGNGNTRIAYYHSTGGVVVTLGDNNTVHGSAIGASTGTDDIVKGVNAVRGSEFNDIITGNAVNNVLEGQGGNDVLNGAAGNDTLTGGTGSDIFVYGSSYGNDAVMDFNRGQGDRIDLRSAGVTSAASLVLTTGTYNSTTGVFTAGAGTDTRITDFADFGSTSSNGIVVVGSTAFLPGDFIFAGSVAVTVQTPDGYDFSTLYGDLAVSNPIQAANDANHIFAVDAAKGITFEMIGTGFTYSSGNVITGTIKEIDILNTTDPTQTTQDHVLVNTNGWNTGAVSLFSAIGAYRTDHTQTAGLDTIFNAATYNIVGSAGFADNNGPSHDGADVFFGGDHADVFNGMPGPFGPGDPGSDTVDYSHATAGIVANLSNPASNAGAAAGDIYISIENLRGTALDDALTGDGNNNVLEGGLGNNTLDGGGGFNTASYEHATAGVTVSLAVSGPQVTGGAGTDTLTNIEGLRGSSFNDHLIGNGSSVLEGGPGDDVLTGVFNGNDTASYEHATAGVTVDLSNSAAQNTGGAGLDTLTNIANLSGSHFNDTLTGNSGNNVFFGNGGHDTFVFNASLGHDTIGDFMTGQDHIELTFTAPFVAGDETSFQNWAASSSHVVQQGNDTLITFDSADSILLKNVNTASLHVSDFILPNHA